MQKGIFIKSTAEPVGRGLSVLTWETNKSCFSKHSMLAITESEINKKMYCQSGEMPS